MKKTFLSLAILILACCWTVEADGHGMSVFASHDGKMVTGTAEYHGGVPVVDSEVIVTAGDGSEYWKDQTNEKGVFAIPVPPRESYTVTVDAGGGHRAKTKIAGKTKENSGASAAQIEEIRREIHDLKFTIRLRDILGGIGYILGLVGIAMYFKAKEKKG